MRGARLPDLEDSLLDLFVGDFVVAGCILFGFSGGKRLVVWQLYFGDDGGRGLELERIARGELGDMYLRLADSVYLIVDQISTYAFGNANSAISSSMAMSPTLRRGYSRGYCLCGSRR